LLSRADRRWRFTTDYGAALHLHYAPGEDLESVDVALIGEAVKQVEAQTCYNDRLSDGKPNPCTV
jgi:hypothetical protein